MPVATFSLVAKHAHERAHQAQAQARIAREVGDHAPLPPGCLPGDPQALRGIPAIGGRGSLGGAIRGTRPDR